MFYINRFQKNMLCNHESTFHMIIKDIDHHLHEYVVAKIGVDETKYKQFLEETLAELNHDGDTFVTYSVSVSGAQFSEYKKLNKLLDHVLREIVNNYFEDNRIREIYRLDYQLETILKEAGLIPYSVGMYRPDILLDTAGQAKICEIGCRYPINGWMVSYYLNTIMNHLIPLEDSSNQSFEKLEHLVSNLAQEFNKAYPIFYIHQKEKGTEAYLLFKELEKLGYTIKNSSPSALVLEHEELKIGNQVATQFIIEMDREELKNIPIEILKKMMASKMTINDVRSTILVHDKRILSVLYNEEIMLDYMSADEYAFLKKYLIPSYTLHSEEIRNTLKTSKENWILKKTSGGRGIDMYVKNECAPELWETLLDTNWKDYMVQEYVSQQEFQLEDTKVNIVGMLLAYNEEVYGLGVYRGSEKSIINVHSGACILPSVLKL